MGRAAGAWALAAATVVLLGACESADQPADPVWGKQPCAHCGMIVGSPRTAAELVTATGTRLYFDDIGCMIAYERDLGERPRRAWVHDADGPSWLGADRAVYTGGERTPMDFGFVAHASGPGVQLGDMQSAVLRRLAEGVGDDDRP